MGGGASLKCNTRQGDLVSKHTEHDDEGAWCKNGNFSLKYFIEQALMTYRPNISRLFSISKEQVVRSLLTIFISVFTSFSYKPSHPIHLI